MVSRWTSVCLSVRPSDSQSVVRPPVRISFPADNLSKLQWIFTKLSICIDVVEIWFGIANGQIPSNLTELSALDRPIFSFPITCINVKGFQPNLVYALILRRSGLGLLLGKFRQCLTKLSARDTILAEHYF